MKILGTVQQLRSVVVFYNRVRSSVSSVNRARPPSISHFLRSLYFAPHTFTAAVGWLASVSTLLAASMVLPIAPSVWLVHRGCHPGKRARVQCIPNGMYVRSTAVPYLPEVQQSVQRGKKEKYISMYTIKMKMTDVPYQFAVRCDCF